MLVFTRGGKLGTSMTHRFTGPIAIHFAKRYMDSSLHVGRHIGSFCITIFQSEHDGMDIVRLLSDFIEAVSSLLIHPSWELGTECKSTTFSLSGEFHCFLCWEDISLL